MNGEATSWFFLFVALSPREPRDRLVGWPAVAAAPAAVAHVHTCRRRRCLLSPLLGFLLSCAFFSLSTSIPAWLADPIRSDGTRLFVSQCLPFYNGKWKLSRKAKVLREWDGKRQNLPNLGKGDLSSLFSLNSKLWIDIFCSVAVAYYFEFRGSSAPHCDSFLRKRPPEKLLTSRVHGVRPFDLLVKFALWSPKSSLGGSLKCPPVMQIKLSCGFSTSNRNFIQQLTYVHTQSV